MDIATMILLVVLFVFVVVIGFLIYRIKKYNYKVQIDEVGADNKVYHTFFDKGRIIKEGGTMKFRLLKKGEVINVPKKEMITSLKNGKPFVSYWVDSEGNYSGKHPIGPDEGYRTLSMDLRQHYKEQIKKAEQKGKSAWDMVPYYVGIGSIIILVAIVAFGLPEVSNSISQARQDTYQKEVQLRELEVEYLRIMNEIKSDVQQIQRNLNTTQVRSSGPDSEAPN